MKIEYDCLPCLTKQTIRLAKRVSTSESTQKQIIKYGLKAISDHAFLESAPYITGLIYTYSKNLTGISDPYSAEKEEFNNIAEKLITKMNLKDMIRKSNNPFDTAVRLSIAGNIIDFSLGIDLEENGVRSSINASLEAELFGSSSPEILNRAQKAKKILFIADNAGEIVFDKLMIEEMPTDKITYVVKGGPIVNDATLKDAQSVGMTELVRVIDNGAAVQGTILKMCSKSFIDEFNEADLIISKGQANYETLSDIKNKEIFYLLRAKCHCIALDIGCNKGDFVILRKK